MVFMDELCGAWQIGDGTGPAQAEFRIFFPAGVDPHVTAIRAAGDFQAQLGGQNWDFGVGIPLGVEPRNDPRGTFWSARTGDKLSSGFYQYKYQVEFDNGTSRIVADPCARYSGLSDQNSGVVVGGSTPQDNLVRPLAGGRQPLTELTIYELMVDDFTAEFRDSRAPLAAVIARLDELTALGVNAIEFMPWTAWANPDFDWGYAPLQYFAVEARYADQLGQPAEKLSWLKELISASHDRGLHVIMDGVYNHVGPDFPYPQLNLEPDTCPLVAAPFGGTFPGLRDLDFAEPITGQFVAEVCTYWIDNFGIDGIRFDNTINFYVPGDLRGLPSLLSGVAAHVEAQGGRNFSMILEHIDESAAQVTNETAATSFWDNSLYALTFDALWNDRIDSRLLNSLNNRRFLSAGKVPTLYLSNHDHSHVAWQTGACENVGASGRWWKVQPFLIALFTSTAVPLVRNGDEIGVDHFIPEDDHGTGGRVVSRPLQWKLRKDQIGSTLTALHSRLTQLRRDHPALRSPLMYPAEWETWQTQFNPVGVGIDVDRQLAIYHRWASVPAGIENVVVVVNFSDTDTVVDVPFPLHGQWTDLLSSFAGGPDWFADVTGPTAPVPVGSRWGRILWLINPGE
jgi:pullulanase